MWTTKGNQHGFIGGAVSFINEQWEFKTRHLTLKLVAWRHKGKWLAEPMVNVLVKHGLVNKISIPCNSIQLEKFLGFSINLTMCDFIHLLCQTTDSGSNNNTMAREMHLQFLDLNDDLSNYTWDPDTMHIYCFCHKMALIVGAGLAALGLKTPPPRKTKTAMRGHFPDVRSTDIIEEEEEEDIPNGNVTEVPDVPSLLVDEIEYEPNLEELAEREEDETEPDAVAYDEDEWDAADAKEADDPLLSLENQVHPTHRHEANKLDALLIKV